MSLSKPSPEALARFQTVAAQLATELREGKLVPGTRSTYDCSAPCCIIGHLHSRCNPDPWSGTNAYDAMEVVLFGKDAPHYLPMRVGDEIRCLYQVNDRTLTPGREERIADQLEVLAATVTAVFADQP